MIAKIETRIRRLSVDFRRALLLLSVPALMASATSVEAWPFATQVFDYQPGPGQWVSDPQYNDPNRALGPPVGGTTTIPNNSKLVTLGDGGYIVLGFDRPIWNDPRNPHGLDFIVFGNATWVGGNPSYRWLEPAFVEISMDVNGNGLPDDEWFSLLPNKLPSGLVGSPEPNPDTGYSHTVLRHYAEYTPTLALPEGKTPEEFYTVPNRWAYEDDPDSLLIDAVSGGGDAFDIAMAVRQAAPGVPAYPLEFVSIPYFNFIRITDAIVGDHAGVLGEISAEIGGVSAVRPLPGGPTIGESAMMSDGEVVSLCTKVVSAVFDGAIYVQEEDRSSGLRIVTNDPASEGDRVDVIGILDTRDGVRFMDQASVYVKSSGDTPRPLGMPARQVGGSGLSNTGLLITTWGRVTSTGEESFSIDDGGSGLRIISSSSSMPSKGEYVLVTGISSRSSYGNSEAPVLRTRKEVDVRIIE